MFLTTDVHGRRSLTFALTGRFSETAERKRGVSALVCGLFNHGLHGLATLTLAIFGMAWAAMAAEPMVTDVTAKQRFPWNGLVDITCNVTGINGTADGLIFAVAAVDTDSGTTNGLRHVWLVQNGTNSIDREVHTNGNYRLLWDAQADLGQVVYSNMVMCVALESHDRVQLWEGGPYWATTNIGADKPEDYGYYFWWGDTVGYKRENDKWVASDGSLSNYSFRTADTPTCDKKIETLQSEGWITADNVLAPEHDAAHVYWGGGWRMPTDQELSCLNNNCDWTWATKNGVNGYEVRGRGDYASNSIFLPCAGYCSRVSFFNAGLNGFYWSSVPYLNPSVITSYAWSFLITSIAHGTRDSSDRSDGFPIRPVQGFNE